MRTPKRGGDSCSAKGTPTEANNKPIEEEISRRPIYLPAYALGAYDNRYALMPGSKNNQPAALKTTMATNVHI
jgi:hypothetical protein